MNFAGVGALPEEGHVHLWWIELDRVTHPEVALCQEERARAERLRQPQDRARWTAARAALRQILTRYVGEAPWVLRLETTAEGKPFLPDAPELRFNLAHAAGCAVLAIARSEVGVDLEPCDAAPVGERLRGVIAATCGGREQASLDALPAAERPAAFLQGWTLKEAYLKGIGVGLARDSRTVDLTLLDERRATVTGDPTWRLTLIPEFPAWTVALAIAQPDEPRIRCLKWPDTGLG